MTPFPYHVNAGDNVARAWQMMKDHGVRHLPVMLDGSVETILSERDIERVIQPGGKIASEGLEVGDLCPPRAYIADVTDPLDRILDSMVAAHIGSVIVTREGELAGIFTERDACFLLAEYLRKDKSEEIDDLLA